MLPSLDEVKTILEQQLPGTSVTIEGGPGPTVAGAGAGWLVVAAKDLIAVSRYLKDTERFCLDYLANLTAVDYRPAAPSGNATGTAQAGPPDPAAGGAGRIEVIYHLYSMEHKHGPLPLKVTLPRTTPAVASVTPVWRAAKFQEREVYDLFGVTFEGHPDLRRILLWEGFEGHPMRKDYVVEDQNVPTPNSPS